MISPSYAWMVLSAVILSGCASSPALHAFSDAGRAIFDRFQDNEPAIALNPKYRYLRARLGRQVAYLALGYVDNDAQGRTEVWYGGSGEVLRTRDGRLVGVSGLPEEWHGVRYDDLPAWDRLGERARYSRRVDADPGHRYGLVENLTIRRIPPPDRHALRGLGADMLTWYEEVSLEHPEVPPSRYALRAAPEGLRVVYTETCLSAGMCLSLQPWQP